MKHISSHLWVATALSALTLTAGLAACSDDDTPQTAERTWTTDGGLRATNDILFDNNN